MEQLTIKDFYKSLKSFLKEIISVFPNDNEFKILSTSLTLASKEQNNKLLVSFCDAFFPLNDYIVNRDEDFFRVKPEDYYKNKHQLKLFRKMKDCYFILSENNKTVVWDYIQNIYSLCKELKV
jgi:hypothetical protein